MAEPKGDNYPDLIELRDDLPYLLGRYTALCDAVCALSEAGTLDGLRGGSKAVGSLLGEVWRRPRRSYMRLVQITMRHVGKVRANFPRRGPEIERLMVSVGARIGDQLPAEYSATQASTCSAGYYHQLSRLLADELDVSQRARDDAMAAAKGWAGRLAEQGMSEVDIAKHLGLSRMTVRAALGK
ncbi:MAG: type I-C CRISPR-associated protein Cas8c/Csd1 [Nocardioides sp.]|uniref:hypothetical protein n=1 Tax=Nocardioides sp. TaxID=35761 RepID=UPI0039E641DF